MKKLLIAIGIALFTTLILIQANLLALIYGNINSNVFASNTPWIAPFDHWFPYFMMVAISMVICIILFTFLIRAQIKKKTK